MGENKPPIKPPPAEDGYDDYFNGGSFLVVNSWGADFGKNGYMWMKYTDFKTYTHRAYAMHVNFESLDELDSNYFARNTWDDGNQIYEGEIFINTAGSWRAEGYGVNYNQKEHQYIVGRWLNGQRQGKFYVVENKKWFTEYYDKGVLQQNYGFSEEDDQLEIYLDSLFSDSEISSINE